MPGQTTMGRIESGIQRVAETGGEASSRKQEDFWWGDPRRRKKSYWKTSRYCCREFLLFNSFNTKIILSWYVWLQKVCSSKILFLPIIGVHSFDNTLYERKKVIRRQAGVIIGDFLSDYTEFFNKNYFSKKNSGCYRI